jgi:nucleotide-binding universal stress UspA family protein
MKSTEEEPTHRIVVGIDGSDSSLAALGWGAHQAESTGSRLEVIMTWEWPTNGGWTVPFPADYTPEIDARRVLDEAVEKLRNTHPEVDVRSTVLEGHPAPALIEASRGADLLVLGSRGHGEFVGMLLGSVSEHCVTHAYCPVLVLRDQE